MFKKILRLPEVISLTGLSRSTVYLRMNQEKFPASISLGPRAIGWLASDIDKWLDQQISASKQIEGGDK